MNSIDKFLFLWHYVPVHALLVWGDEKVNKGKFLEKELRLNSIPSLNMLLRVWAKEVGLGEEARLEVRLVVRRESDTARKRRALDSEPLSEKRWEQILSYEFWSTWELAILNNFKKNQARGELKIPTELILKGLGTLTPKDGIDFYRQWHKFYSSINRRLIAVGSPCRVRKSRQTKYGIFETISR